MASTVKNLPLRTTPAEQISLLVVSPEEQDLTAVRSVFHHHTWKVQRGSSLGEARASLTASSVVLCERELPDGSWKDVLGELERIGSPAALVVISGQADELLWAEVLNMGGYDVLPKPLDKTEVTRVVGMAWRHAEGLRRKTAATYRPALEQVVAPAV
ncbi:MAG: response regulator [Bryobacteraceae bacterium]|nr:response regulator [Bryobacteraceae bacterium]